jgi:hypothetical protein
MELPKEIRETWGGLAEVLLFWRGVCLWDMGRVNMNACRAQDAVFWEMVCMRAMLNGGTRVNVRGVAILVAGLLLGGGRLVGRPWLCDWLFGWEIVVVGRVGSCVGLKMFKFDIERSRVLVCANVRLRILYQVPVHIRINSSTIIRT